MKFNCEIIYIGDIVKIVDGEEVIVSHDETLSYNDINDMFCSFNGKGWRSFFLLVNYYKNISEEEKRELEDNMDNDFIPYKEHGIEGDTYVKTSSIRELTDKKVHGRK